MFNIMSKKRKFQEETIHKLNFSENLLLLGCNFSIPAEGEVEERIILTFSNCGINITTW